MRASEPVHGRSAASPPMPGIEPNGAWRREFPGAERSVAEAREWARDLLRGWMSAPALDDVVLLLSEVVTNAVAHSYSGRAQGGRVTVRMACETGGVRVEVCDGGSATSVPTVREPGIDDDGGRGLWLVNVLADVWGAHQDATGGTVWFRVAARV